METTSQVPVKTRPTKVTVGIELIGRKYVVYVNDKMDVANTRESAIRFVMSKLEEIA